MQNTKDKDFFLKNIDWFFSLLETFFTTLVKHNKSMKEINYSSGIMYAEKCQVKIFLTKQRINKLTIQHSLLKSLKDIRKEE